MTYFARNFEQGCFLISSIAYYYYFKNILFMTKNKQKQKRFKSLQLIDTLHFNIFFCFTNFKKYLILVVLKNMFFLYKSLLEFLI